MKMSSELVRSSPRIGLMWSNSRRTYLRRYATAQPTGLLVVPKNAI